MTGRLVAHVLMAVAEWERDAIGQRTSEAIRARLARGEDWGRAPTLPPSTESLIADLREEGLTAHAIVRHLNDNGVPTARGGTWHSSTVSRVLKRLDRRANASAA